MNSRVTEFVRELVKRGRGERALFDVLPPQRRTLAERGLLGSSRRAVVVSLPTSSGKTLIALFRMLQALNQFEDRKGWVAYLAPTRALVNQVTRQLRRDFEPLGLLVERASPAMVIDGVEAGMLMESRDETKFRILVATPEKFDLMLRQDWEEKIGRPLSLVVVDEAHTIQQGERGLRLELLLATIDLDVAFSLGKEDTLATTLSKSKEVGTLAAITARTLSLLGVPRRAATPLARALNLGAGESLPTIRQRLAALSQQDWTEALGSDGNVYRKAWQIMDGVEE